MLTDSQVIIRLVMAAIFGGLIGYEREKHHKTAGLRTHILVCIGSCLIMLVSIYMFESFSAITAIDPSRIAAGVITGIGFLGAGAIIQSGASVKGLTTAASLWTVSGIGLAIGCGFYIASSITTVLVLFVLYFLRKWQIDEKKEVDYDEERKK